MYSQCDCWSTYTSATWSWVCQHQALHLPLCFFIFFQYRGSVLMYITLPIYILTDAQMSVAFCAYILWQIFLPTYIYIHTYVNKWLYDINAHSLKHIPDNFKLKTCCDPRDTSSDRMRNCCWNGVTTATVTDSYFTSCRAFETIGQPLSA